MKQIATTIDDYLWTPDHKVVEGEIEEGKRYREPQFNGAIEITERERYRVKLFMDQIDQRKKTPVFCATQGHAALVRELINQMKTSSDPNCCVRVTANDGRRARSGCARLAKLINAENDAIERLEDAGVIAAAFVGVQQHLYDS